MMLVYLDSDVNRTIIIIGGLVNMMNGNEDIVRIAQENVEKPRSGIRG